MMIAPSAYQVVLMQDMANGTPVSLTFAPTLIRRLLKRLIATGFCEPVARTFEDDSAVYEFCTLTVKGTTYLEAIALQASYQPIHA
jgi:hypothetical protein